eukprot:gene17176-biopygen2309
MCTTPFTITMTALTERVDAPRASRTVKSQSKGLPDGSAPRLMHLDRVQWTVIDLLRPSRPCGTMILVNKQPKTTNNFVTFKASLDPAVASSHEQDFLANSKPSFDRCSRELVSIWTRNLPRNQTFQRRETAQKARSPVAGRKKEVPFRGRNKSITVHCTRPRCINRGADPSGSWCINTLSHCSHCNCERRCAHWVLHRVIGRSGATPGGGGSPAGREQYCICCASQQPGMELQCNLCALALQLDRCMAQCYQVRSTRKPAAFEE